MKPIHHTIKPLSHQKRLLYILTLLAILTTSCEKLVEVPPPANQLAAREVFQSEATAQAVLNNLYPKAYDLCSSQISAVLLGAYSSDETEIYSTSASQQQLANNQLLPTNTYSAGFWPACYQVIYLANVTIEGSDNSTVLSKATKDKIKGEALFFRALAHLYLTSFYGEVPLILSTDYARNTIAPKSTTKEIYEQIIQDLQLSASLLPSDYAQSNGERIRINSYAAKALLARAYLYNSEYEKAEAAATEVLNNTTLFALGTLADAFARNGRESIFQFRPSSLDFNTSEGNYFILTARPTNAAMRKSFYDGFEAGDQRKTSWTSKVTVSGTDYYFPFKYKVKTSTTLSEYSTILRVAELCLIRSEARARLDKLPLAIADLDLIRQRANLPRIAITNPTIAKEALLDAILMERRSELFFEGAHRWIDLKRFGKSQAVLSAIKPGWKANSLLFPIPPTDIQLNYNLTQNPGY